MRHLQLEGITRTLALAGILAAGLAAVVVLGGCEVAEPALPRFTTQLALPIGDDRLDVLELVEDEDYLVALEDGGLGFTVSGDPDTISLDFDLAAELPGQILSNELGSFDLDPTAPDPFAFPLGDLYPPAAGLDGLTTPVPAFPFNLAGDPAAVPDMTSATVESGTLDVTITNGLPVPVSGPAAPAPLQFRLYDPAHGTTLALVDFPDEIPAGATVYGAADLAGVVIPAEVAVELTGASAGSAAPVAIDAASEVAVSSTFSNLTVSAAEAPVPAQSFTTDLVVDLPADYAVLAADVATGALSVAMNNDLAIPCRVEITWPEVFTQDGGNLTAVLDLAPGAAGRMPMDFAGCTIVAGGAPLAALTAAVSVTSPGSGGQSVQLAADQAVRVEVGSGRVEFAEVTGEVPAFSFDLDPIQESIDLPDELQGMSLTAATLTLEVANFSGVDAVADLLLTGTSADGAVVSLPLQETLTGYGEPTRGFTAIIRDETNSTIVDFLNNLPTSISLGGTITAGGDGQVGTVRPGDRAVLGWGITAPVEITVDESVIHGDPEALDFDEDTRDLILERAGAARLMLEIGNRLPVAVHARVLFAPDTTTIADAPILAVGPIEVAAGVVDPVTHQALAVNTSHPVIELSAAEMRLLATPDLYAVIEVVLPGTAGAPARIMTDDYVTFRGLVQLDVEVSE
jgi:hypothetical protein